jgi:hypothetical protein
MDRNGPVNPRRGGVLANGVGIQVAAFKQGPLKKSLAAGAYSISA